MKNLIFITCILASLALKANDINLKNIKFVDVKSKKIIVNISKNDLYNDASQLMAPNLFQSTLTINASGILSYQCNTVHNNVTSIHNHNLIEAIK